MFPEAIVRNHPHIDCCHQHLNLRVTLDGPLEEGLASLARGDPVVEPGGHVAAHETTPLRLFLFILDHLAKTITMMMLKKMISTCGKLLCVVEEHS